MSKLQVETISHTNNTTAMTINSGGLVIPKSVVLSVNASNTDQSIGTNTLTKVEWENVELDTISGWSTTNHRYTPTVAGYYLVGGALRAEMSSLSKHFRTEVRKNGSSGNDSLHIQLNYDDDRLTNSVIPLGSGLMQLNGSSDYLEVWVRLEESGTLHDTDGFKSYFFAQLVHAT